MTDLKQLQAKFPKEFQLVFDAGRAAEADRVQALLHAGSVAQCPDLALQAIRDGRNLDAALSAVFLERGLAARDQRNRQEDDGEVALAADGAASTSTTAGKSPDDVVADLVVASMKEGRSE